MNTNSNDTGSSSNDSTNSTNSNDGTTAINDTTPASPAVQFSHDVQVESAAAEAAGPVVADESPLMVVNDVTFTVDGIVKGAATVPFGTKVKDALKKIAEGVVATTLSIRDSAGKAVGLERSLTESMSVVSVAKAAGG